MKQNIEAIDIARGASILLVVLHHTILYLTANNEVLWFIPKMNEILAYVRMPTFFLISGVLAGSATRKPWREFLSSKIVVLLWLFVVWSVVRFAYFGAIYPNIRDLKEGSDFIYLFSMIFDPRTGIWFLWALMIFFVLAKALSSANRAFVIGLAAVASLLAFGNAIPGLSWPQMNAPKYAVFFLFGSFYASDIKSFIQHGGTKLFWRGLIVFVLAIAAIEIIDGPVQWPIEVLAGAAGVGAGLGGACLLAGTAAAGVLTFFGRRTLPIYVAHVPIVATVADLMADAFPQHFGISLGLIATVILIAVGSSLALEALLLRLGAKWFYSPPKFISNAMLKTTVAPAAE
ncbi:acyltransferase family protein [Rhizobium sp. GCM10022189]|jgi:uncharacterized membrane protein YcfT|uniref:acyltransferase family protein n=1 Tax=Rhizobium sp. GCM10022189 TaxID=3252654 RepID=UPI0036227E6E